MLTPQGHEEISMSRVLQGRVALITGVSRRAGIGFAIASRLASHGADLFVHSWSPYDRQQPWGADPGDIDAVLAELQSHDTRVAHAEADFLAPEAPREVMRRAVEVYGHVDILIVNHAYSTQHSAEALAEDTLSVEDIDRHLLVNVRASLLLIAAFARQHDRRLGGRIILLTSGQHLGPMPTELAYAASKGALHQLTPSLSECLIGRGITVNTVNPGPTDTGWATKDVHAWMMRHMPQGRWGQPDDTARLIAWLVSDDAAWITGQVIISEGGFRRF
jgi:3-oxoacyl-[acyl-carrier protein] reductase